MVANKFGIALANISKMPVLTAGVLADAAALLAKEGCLALDTHRVGIWTTTDEASILKSIAYYDYVRSLSGSDWFTYIFKDLRDFINHDFSAFELNKEF